MGPLAWTALQHLALTSQRTDQGWAVAVGVREIAAGLGVTKDTAARAISVLVDSGLVSRGRIKIPGGHPRSGYVLNLPSPIRLIDWPIHHEGGWIEAARPPRSIDAKQGGRRLGGLLHTGKEDHGPEPDGTGVSAHVTRPSEETSWGRPVLVGGQRRDEVPADLDNLEEMR
jgi:hypothetical protein